MAIMMAAAISQPRPGEICLSGEWNAYGAAPLEAELDAISRAADPPGVINGEGVTALDSAGAWLIRRLISRLRERGKTVALRGWNPRFGGLLDRVQVRSATKPAVADEAKPSILSAIGRGTSATLEQAHALLTLTGASAVGLTPWAARAGVRWRMVLANMQSAGVSALPIVGLLAFLVGIVVAYQAATQLRRYGANLFIVDLIGLSMLREFAPLITAIIVAGRSGSAYTAQIGTMAVTEEIDAMRTLGMSPIQILVLPKIVALVLVLPLLTVYADIVGTLGGMVMARAQLGLTYAEFLDRFVTAVDATSFLLGVGKAPVFAAAIALVGCLHGLRTRGGADAVGRQTTRSVVQAIFIVIVADALFSIWFSVLGL